MSSTIHPRIQLKRDTTENWNNAIGFIPLPGEVIIYEDYDTKTYEVEEYGETVTKTVNIPNIKIGTGNAYVQDLAFVNESTSIPEVVQSDWEEDDTTSLAHVLNRPAIRAGEGENSIIEGQLEENKSAAIYTIYVTGDKSETTFTYTTEDTLPNTITVLRSGYVVYVDEYQEGHFSKQYNTIISIDTSGNVTFARKLSSFTGTVENAPVQIYYRQHSAEGEYAHAEGSITSARVSTSHAEGTGSCSLAMAAHAEGAFTTAMTMYSHSEGYHTIASGSYQHVQGKWNIPDNNNIYADIVGNGSSSTRSNAYTLDWSGNGWYAGKVTVGANPTADMDVATKQYVDSATSESVKRFIVTVTETADVETGDITYSADKTFVELTEAYEDGYELVCRVNSMDGGASALSLLSMTEIFAMFELSAMRSDGVPAAEIVKINSDDTIQHQFTAFEETQSNWNEDDTTSSAYILNRPAIRAGEGENSVIVGNIDQEEATGITIYLTGEAGALTYSYTPSIGTRNNYTVVKYNNEYYAVNTMDLINSTITFYSSLSTTALSNVEVLCFNKGLNGATYGKHAYLEGGARGALADYAHAEGYYTYAIGRFAHAEGGVTCALGTASHSEGRYSIANGERSHSEGIYTIANGDNQHVQGKYNIPDDANIYADIVGNGTGKNARSNAYTLDWSGNGWYAGKLTVGTGPTNDMDVVTKQYMENKGYLTLADLPIYDGTVV